MVGILANVLLHTRKKQEISQNPEMLQSKDTIPKRDKKVMTEHKQENILNDVKEISIKDAKDTYQDKQ